jgi:adenosylcobyric acid synthase
MTSSPHSHGGNLLRACRRFGRTDFIDFSSNLNPFANFPLPTHPALQSAVNRYPSADGDDIVDLFSQTLAHPAHQILPTAGAIEGIYLATRLFRDHQGIIPAPAFPDYLRSAHAAGIHVDPHRQPASDLGSLEQSLRAKKAASNNIPAVVILGNPNNPTGTLHSKPDLLRIINSTRHQGVTWIIDEAFIHLASPNASSILPDLQHLPNVLVVGAWTKSCAIPGLRLGYLATSNPTYLDQLRAIQPPWSVNGPAGLWARTHLNNTLPAVLQEHAQRIEIERNHLTREINHIAGLQALPSQANFLLIQSTRIPGDELRNRLGKKGFLLRDHEGLRMNADLSRCAVRSRPENHALLEALDSALNGCQPKASPPSNRAPAKVIAILGSSSNSGKSWVATALCRCLANRGVRVAPFKAQNMSNNSAATPCGAEIGRAQAAQAEASRIAPDPRMNPVLLKPAGNGTSQLVVLGTPKKHIPARQYYQEIEPLRTIARNSLDQLRDEFDVVIAEGAGSPVELNLLERDIANLDPVRHSNGKWILVTDIEKGGVFAQAAGTWNLLAPRDQSSCIGLIVNKFRGDLRLFDDAPIHFSQIFGAPFLGTLPFEPHLQPESEDSLSHAAIDRNTPRPIDHSKCLIIRWIRFPHTSNAQDIEPWIADPGVDVAATIQPDEIESADLLVLPGSKNTIDDLDWLRKSGLETAILTAAKRGVPIIGICGGFQMLGENLHDPAAHDGSGGSRRGLALLPVTTTFAPTKTVKQVLATFNETTWQAYEIHMGVTVPSNGSTATTKALFSSSDATRSSEPEGIVQNNIMGTYLHGCFESPALRRHLCRLARPDLDPQQCIHPVPWQQSKDLVYDGMANLLERHLNLAPIMDYLLGKNGL